MIFGALVEVHGFPTAWRALAFFEAFGVIPALLASRAVSRTISAAA